MKIIDYQRANMPTCWYINDFALMCRHADQPHIHTIIVYYSILQLQISIQYKTSKGYHMSCAKEPWSNTTMKYPIWVCEKSI